VGQRATDASFKRINFRISDRRTTFGNLHRHRQFLASVAMSQDGARNRWLINVVEFS
jgi:hypothetical protein